MNDVFLRGTIKNIQYSHTTKNVAYDRAHLIVRNSNNDYSIIDLLFKEYLNYNKDGDQVCLIGNVRTRSEWSEEEQKNKTKVYVYTFFNNLPEDQLVNQPFKSMDNILQFDGEIKKIGSLRKFKNNKVNIQVLVKNSIGSGDKEIVNYIPCLAWGQTAKAVSKFQEGEKVVITGELRSHEYQKRLDSGQMEIRVAHEAIITTMCREEDME